MQISPIWSRSRERLAAALLLMLILFACPDALAQREPGDDSAVNKQIEEIVVTGSRIKRTEFSSSSPIQIIDMEAATLAGQVDIADILQQSTVAANAPQVNNGLGYAPFYFGNTVDTVGGPGINTINLRGLGIGKTLVLLNGRRLNPAGTRGTVSAVDLNTIPSSIIERIEILKDGASSVYGSDAVAGVINMITKKGADGVGGSVSYSAPFDGGGKIKRADLSVGISSGDWSFLFGIDYFEQEQLQLRDRKWAQCRTDLIRDPETGEDLSTIDPATGQPKCHDSTAYDYVIHYGDVYTTGRTSRSIFDASIDDWRIGSVAERKQDHSSADGSTLISPVKRSSVFSFGNWAMDGLGSNTEGYYEVLYNSRRSDQNYGPRQFGTWFYDSPWSPFYNEGGWAQDVPLLIPYVGTPSQEVDWLRGILGSTGELSNGWSWDVNVGYGRSEGTYSSPELLSDRILNMQDLVEVDEGDYDCAVNSDPGTDGTCVPLNPYEIIQSGINSPESFPKDILNYMMSIETGNTVYSQKSVMAYLSGRLFNLPAGSVEAVIGVEGRREAINDTPSSNTINHNLYEGPTNGITTGEDTVTEVFAELELPILNDVAAARDLTLSVAGRYSSYDTAGSDTTYRVGLNWQIIDQLRLRSSFGTSFRAPSLYESFLNGQTSAARVADPCVEYRDYYIPGDPVYENCLAEVGDADYNVWHDSTIFTFGNAGRIEAETSESLNVGLVVELEVVDLAIALDYFEFTIEDEIDRYGPSDVVYQCYSLPPSKFRQPKTICDYVSQRDPLTLIINEVNDSYFNINEKYQDGLDLTVHYTFAVRAFDFVADLRATKILSFTQDLFGGEVDDYNGRIGYADLNGQFDLRAMFREWTFYYGLNYIGDQSDYSWTENDPSTSILVLDTESVTYHDLAVGYDGNGWSAQVGIKNVNDRRPPMVSRFIASHAGNAALNTGYDYRGRTFFVNVAKGF